MVEEPVSGRVLEMSVTAPGIQFYTGNFLDGTYFGKGQRAYRQGDAICLEPGVFPDSPNHPDFPTVAAESGPELRQHHRLQVQREVASSCANARIVGARTRRSRWTARIAGHPSQLIHRHHRHRLGGMSKDSLPPRCCR